MDNQDATATPCRSIFDLPVEDIVVTHIAKYLTLTDIFNFRTCSRDCRDLANTMLSGRDEIAITQVTEMCGEMSFRIIIQNCRKLKRFRLHFLNWLTDEMLIEFLQNNPLLEMVEFYYCQNVTPEGLRPLISCRNIVSLWLALMKCDDNILLDMSLHNNNLIEVNLSSVWKFSLECLVEFFKKEPKLQVIFMPSIEDGQQVVRTIVEHCPEIRNLCITDCEPVTDDLVLEIIRKCSMLKVLCLPWFYATELMTKKVKREIKKKNIYLGDPGQPYFRVGKFEYLYHPWFIHRDCWHRDQSCVNLEGIKKWRETPWP